MRPTVNGQDDACGQRRPPGTVLTSAVPLQSVGSGVLLVDNGKEVGARGIRPSAPFANWRPAKRPDTGVRAHRFRLPCRRSR
jgi:hypothetical protein